MQPATRPEGAVYPDQAIPGSINGSSGRVEKTAIRRRVPPARDRGGFQVRR